MDALFQRFMDQSNQAVIRFYDAGGKQLLTAVLGEPDEVDPEAGVVQFTLKPIGDSGPKEMGVLATAHMQLGEYNARDLAVGLPDEHTFFHVDDLEVSPGAWPNFGPLRLKVGSPTAVEGSITKLLQQTINPTAAGVGYVLRARVPESCESCGGKLQSRPDVAPRHDVPDGTNVYICPGCGHMEYVK